MYDGFGWQFRKGFYTAPADFKWRQTSGYTVTLEHQFADWLSARASWDWYHNPIETFDMLRSGAVFDTGTKQIARSSTSAVNWATIYGTGYSYSADLLAHYKVKAVDLQSLLTVDDYLNNRRDYTKTMIPGSFSVTYLKTPIDPTNPASVIAPAVPLSEFTAFTKDNNAVDAKGLGFTQQANLFHERVIVYGGFRYDYVSGDERALATATSTPTEGKVHESNHTYKVGLSVKLTPDDSAYPLSWYASRIESFIPFSTNLATNIVNAPPSETGLSYESGLKGSFFQHAFSFTADAFATYRKNVGVSELSNPNDPSSPTITVPEGDQNSKGFRIRRRIHGSDPSDSTRT